LFYVNSNQKTWSWLCASDLWYSRVGRI